MEALSWIGDLVGWFANWIPRMEICRATHRGVKFVRGKHVKEINPGLYMYWPMTTECVTIPVVRQSVNLSPQTLTTKDGHSVMVSPVLIYEIDDIRKALADSYDVDDTITEIGGLAIVDAVTSRTFEEIREDITTDVKRDITEKSRRLLTQFGVKVRVGLLSDFAKCRVIRIAGDGPSVISDEEEDE